VHYSFCLAHSTTKIGNCLCRARILQAVWLFGCLACPLCAALPSGHDHHLTWVFAGASSTRSFFGQLIGDHAALTTPAHYAPHISP
ncbi:hypothetical protein P692DRAFT_20398215, partial [Suillus brevipes Sb2]